MLGTYACILSLLALLLLLLQVAALFLFAGLASLLCFSGALILGMAMAGLALSSVGMITRTNLSALASLLLSVGVLTAEGILLIFLFLPYV
jgi:hypothetical protein